MKRYLIFRIDWRLFIPAFVLVMIGLTTLFSINPAFFKGQMFSIIIAVIAFLFFSQIHYTAYNRLSLYIYLISLILLTVVLLLGDEARGAVRWIYVLGIPIQFSEVLKPFLAISLASFLSTKENITFKTFFLNFVLVTPITFLIAKQPDLGNALIYFSVLMLVMIIYGIPWKWFGFLLLPFIFLSPFLWGILHDYQRQRILTFLHPTNDPLGTSYNLIQAIIAVGSGKILGKGFGESTQSGLRFLPERQTDFIYASLAESLGFIGAVLVLIIFFFLLYRIYKLFCLFNNNFAKIFSATCFCFLMMHVFINIGMNIGLFPVVGITLPFISYGGSSLLANFIFLGILSSFSSSIREKDVLEIK